ncbi:MAG: ABC transporter permease [Gammaproteobacteria bacterium]|nr:ABC transporter permease [Gammaproteobacteria bacterium]
MSAQDAANPDANIVLANPDTDTLDIVLQGSWRLQDRIPSIESVVEEITSSPRLQHISISSSGITAWDSGLLVFLSGLIRSCQDMMLHVNTDGLPGGIRKLLDLAASSAETKESSRHDISENLLSRIGNTTIDIAAGVPSALRFLGESLKSIVRLIRRKAQYNSSDLYFIIQQVGPQALPIVSLISFLVGLILAYMGALQLERFGAQIYVADLVGIAMVREVGALMTAIIMAGRTGAAYAAELGTMQVNEEIDAFQTLGISPMDYLVMPRLLALVLMMPLLSLYAGLVGILAGIVVSVTVFDLSVYEYYQQTLRALNMTHFTVGMMKGMLYGVLIALAGCLRGMQCGRSAQAVGQATTSAVVTSIISIVIAASLTTVILQQLGI